MLSGLSICGLPPSVPLLLPPFCRKVAPSTTRDLGERCKDPTASPRQSFGRQHSEWVHLIQFSVSYARSEPLWGPQAADILYAIVLVI